MLQLVSKEVVAEQTYLLTLHSPELVRQAQAGQFVNIRVDQNSTAPLLRRPFTISNVHNETFDLLVQIVGHGTRLLVTKAIGEMLDVVGPLGNSFDINSNFDHAILVAGGVGVAPMPFLTKKLLEMGKEITTFVGFRSKAQVYVTNLNNVHIATDDGTEGFHGNVVELLQRHFQNSEKKIKIFACGPTPMLRALTTYAREKRICCEVSLEGEMACGVGICQGCPVERRNAAQKYALVCKEGPNFNSEEIEL